MLGLDPLSEQFYQVMTRLKANSRAAAASTPMVTEVTNGLIVTRPAKKFQEYNNEAKTKTDKEPEVIDLQEYLQTSQRLVLFQ